MLGVCWSICWDAVGDSCGCEAGVDTGGLKDEEGKSGSEVVVNIGGCGAACSGHRV